jgi:hypothetical protein
MSSRGNLPFAPLRVAGGALRGCAAGRRHRGITLPEVIISIFILAIGVLGVAALLPVGNVEVQRASITHRGAELGLRTYRELRLRGWMQPEMWMAGGGGPVVDESGRLQSQYRGKPLAIDPVGVAVSQGLAQFPANSGNSMPRLTLRRSMSKPQAMSPEMALEMFVSRDTLVFDRPNDPLLPARQFPEGEQPGSKRRIEDLYSWLVTLVPQGNESGMYTASVVVMYRNLPSKQDGSPRDEHVLTNVQPRGGDEYQVTADKKVIQALEPRRWLMLTDGGRFDWYRIITVDASRIDDRSECSLTLAGPQRTQGAGQTLTGVYIPGAIAVYEKIVHVEGPTLWWPKGRFENAESN